MNEIELTKKLIEIESVSGDFRIFGRFFTGEFGRSLAK